MVLRLDPAIVAHPDKFRVVRIGEHRMLARQFFDDPLDRAANAKRATAFDAGVGLFLVEDYFGQRAVRQVQTWQQRQRIFRTDRNTQSTLQAGVFLKADLRQIGMIAQRTRWA